MKTWNIRRFVIKNLIHRVTWRQSIGGILGQRKAHRYRIGTHTHTYLKSHTCYWEEVLVAISRSDINHSSSPCYPFPSLTTLLCSLSPTHTEVKKSFFFHCNPSGFSQLWLGEEEKKWNCKFLSFSHPILFSGCCRQLSFGKWKSGFRIFFSSSISLNFMILNSPCAGSDLSVCVCVCGDRMRLDEYLIL